MNAVEDKPLRALGDMLRKQRETADQRALEALCAGELSAEERAALEARCTQEPELDLSLQAYMPLDASARVAIAESVLSALRGQIETQAAAPPNVVSLDRRRRSRFANAFKILVPMCAAAAIGLWVARNDNMSVAPLPDYQLQVLSAPAETRGNGDQGASSLRVSADTRLRILLRPTTDAGSDVTARAYLVNATTIQTWPGDVTLAASGAVQLVLAPPPAVVHAGDEVRILVGRAALLSKRADELARGFDDRGEGFQRFHLSLSPRSP